MLTPKQKELLMFIHERLKESGVPPSFDEMKDALDLKSKSGIHRLITALEERGFIRRLAHRARALEVLKLPESAAATPPTADAAPGYAQECRRSTLPARRLGDARCRRSRCPIGLSGRRGSGPGGGPGAAAPRRGAAGAGG